MKLRLPVILVLFFVLVLHAFADFQTALDAYNNKDSATALKEFQPLAEQGDARAQYYLGDLYGFGDGVSQNDAEAEKWFQLALENLPKLAEKGDAEAQYELGLMSYDWGGYYGIPFDVKEIVKWWTMAAEQGHVEAQKGLGEVYYYGEEGVPKDYKEAAKWYRMAAEQGDKEARDLIYFLNLLNR